ncbi:type II secretion system protein N [Paracoccus sp. SM22M-07]|uniref:type II secretion system protein N n=1 Tax=Paracoccus sp. SM22M-07 TaxID=1520813 RepID=UPI0009F962D9|nr:type II secretion system protein N [Paracoccus sp. SM22M-07]
MTGTAHIGGHMQARAGRAGVWMLTSASRAVIAGREGSAASYQIGAQVRGDINLVEINPDHIVLRVDGRPQTLSFPTRATAPATANPTIKEVTEAAPTGPSNAARQVIGSSPASRQANATGVRDDRKATPPSDVVPMILQAGMHPHDMLISTKGSQVGAMKADRQFHDQVAESGRADVDMRRGGRVIVLGLSLG